MCPNFGTPKNILHLVKMENLLLLGVQILKHITVVSGHCLSFCLVQSSVKNLFFMDISSTAVYKSCTLYNFKIF